MNEEHTSITNTHVDTDQVDSLMRLPWELLMIIMEHTGEPLQTYYVLRSLNRAWRAYLPKRIHDLWPHPLSARMFNATEWTFDLKFVCYEHAKEISEQQYFSPALLTRVRMSPQAFAYWCAYVSKSAYAVPVCPCYHAELARFSYGMFTTR